MPPFELALFKFRCWVSSIIIFFIYFPKKRYSNFKKYFLFAELWCAGYFRQTISQPIWFRDETAHSPLSRPRGEVACEGGSQIERKEHPKKAAMARVLRGGPLIPAIFRRRAEEGVAALLPHLGSSPATPAAGAGRLTHTVRALFPSTSCGLLVYFPVHILCCG